MDILHALFTRVRGGLEQAFVNDTQAFHTLGHRVTAVVHPDAPYRSDLKPFTAGELAVAPKGFYDVFSIARVRMHLRKTRPDLIIAHNGRAITLMAYAAWGLGIPVVGVTHSYKATHVLRAHRLVVLSQHMHAHFKASGVRKPLHIIPNLMHLPPKPARKPYGTPVCVGAMGRLSPEKGFDDLLHALKLLRERGLEFTARLGGEGPDAEKLKQRAGELGLADRVEWLGWVKDKEAFFNSIDVFCIPSHQESLPMVMIEGMIHCAPIITTDALLPSGVVADGDNCLIAPHRQPRQLADALERVLRDEALAVSLREAAWQTVQHYEFTTVSQQWKAFFESISNTQHKHAVGE